MPFRRHWQKEIIVRKCDLDDQLGYTPWRKCARIRDRYSRKTQPTKPASKPINRAERSGNVFGRISPEIEAETDP